MNGPGGDRIKAKVVAGLARRGYFKQALRFDPDADAWVGLGDELWVKMKRDEAYRAYGKALSGNLIEGERARIKARQAVILGLKLKKEMAWHRAVSPRPVLSEPVVWHSDGGQDGDTERYGEPTTGSEAHPLEGEVSLT